MTTIGNDIKPGPVTMVTSANFVSTSANAPRDGALIGPADIGSDPSQGNGNYDTVYYLIDTGQAEDLFGRDSMLTEQVKLALANTASPIYAIAPSEVSVSAEDLGVSATGEFENGPHPEDPDHYSVTVDSNSVDPVVVYDLASYTPSSSEIAINPVTKEFKLESAPSSSITADYTHLDYQGAVDEVREKVPTVVDFIAPIQESVSAVSAARDAVLDMQLDEDFALAIGGIAPFVDTNAYTNDNFSTSRVQLYYPTRDSEYKSIIGAIVGRRAGLGLSTSAIRTPLYAVGRLADRLDDTDIGNLNEQRVNSVEYQAGTAILVDDYTTAPDTDADESGYNTGFSRMVMDEVILQTTRIENQFIGKLNTQDTRNSLKSELTTELSGMVDSNSIENFQIRVTESTANSANVRINVETVRGLRNVYNTITAGIREDLTTSQEQQDTETAQSNTEADTGADN